MASEVVFSPFDSRAIEPVPFGGQNGEVEWQEVVESVSRLCLFKLFLNPTSSRFTAYQLSDKDLFF